ncbi:hypothetical protein EYF80_032223 [Liparis tanakae]|uniref:Uncharacterized protein n=1 Tax=Liparis tanakae TaxID=230148 RepID=A0A4Z2GV99_9TELE|nr:hypothetical protein EYF80_032223 [Liparis tanakae]
MIVEGSVIFEEHFQLSWTPLHVDDAKGPDHHQGHRSIQSFCHGYATGSEVQKLKYQKKKLSFIMEQHKQSLFRMSLFQKGLAVMRSAIPTVPNHKEDRGARAQTAAPAPPYPDSNAPSYHPCYHPWTAAVFLKFTTTSELSAFKRTPVLHSGRRILFRLNRGMKRFHSHLWSTRQYDPTIAI